MSASNPYDLSEGRKGLKSGMREHCQCQYCEHQRQEEAQGPRPRWLQREFDAARKATAPPAAGPWVTIEPGCEMPERGTYLVCVVVGGDLEARIAHFDGTGWSTGYYLTRCMPTHYAVLQMPETITGGRI